MSKNNTAKETCSPNCPYFPDMSIKEDEWIFDETRQCKVRKRPKVFKCLYTNEPIRWDVKCQHMTKA